MPFTYSLQHSNTLKGLAILAVILVHVLAYLPGIYHGSQQSFWVGIDQLARFCVPAFLLVSGYGLAHKYSDQPLRYSSFIFDRVIKLLPLYLLWSIASMIIIALVPAWSFANQAANPVLQILFGQADYQLYFVPILVQLYVLFPLLWHYRKHPHLLLLSTLLIQSAAYLIYPLLAQNNERLEYVLAFSWIGYFTLGLYLRLVDIPTKIYQTALLLGLLCLAYLTIVTTSHINQGLDPLLALKFTKLSVIPYAILFNLGLLWRIRQRTHTTLAWLGEHSYLIFLAHTIGLRIGYTLLQRNGLDHTIIWASGLWLLTITLSQTTLLGTIVTRLRRSTDRT